jgi:tartrate-resistant acid phosphatase type 5
VSNERQVHSEPFVHLVDLSHDRVLVAWGAFAFRRDAGAPGWDIVDDEQLEALTGRRTCIGSSAEPFGAATVEILDLGGRVVASESTSDRAWVWVDGLEPGTEYRYRVLVDGEEWAGGERWDWVPSELGGFDLAPAGREYDLRFRTWPPPDAPTPGVRFVAMGDYGVGIRSDAESSRRQRRIAEVLDRLVADCDVAFVVSLGDNIYQGEDGRVDDESGGEDDDWYSSFFQPYRYALARVPFFPAIGNHDTSDTEGSDDRAQLEDNFHLRERFHGESDRASVGPGLFYRLGYGADLELVCIDTSQDDSDESVHRYFQAPEHAGWLDETFSPRGVRWLIPFSHHPTYCAGPEHHNDDEMRTTLLPLWERAGVPLVLAGHEHNFQLSEADGRTYVVSGAGGKLREEVPDNMAGAHTTGWAAQAHLLVVDIEGDEARLTPVAGLLDDGRPHRMTLLGPGNEVLLPPFTVGSAAGGRVGSTGPSHI